MEERISLEQLLTVINLGFTGLNQRMDAFDKRLGMVEKRLDNLEAKMEEGFRALKDRMDRVEFAVYETQKETENFHGEMRGIHKVLDNFSTRLVRVEGHLGFLPSPEPA